MDDKGLYITQCRRIIAAGLVFLICIVSIINLVHFSNSSGIIKLASVPTQEPNQNNTSNAETIAPQQADLSVNPVTKAAEQFGVRSCINRINQVSSFLTANNSSGAYIFTPQAPPNEHIFSTSLELIRQDNSILYASANFFPNQDTVYDTVEYVNSSCEELEKTIFKNLKRIGVIKKNIILLDSGAVKVFLMPAGSGCVVIKKEVVRQ